MPHVRDGQRRGGSRGWVSLGPATGAVPMATGIVSVALLLNGNITLSRILLGLTVVTWIPLGALAVRRLLRDPDGFVGDAASPPALTAVAATAVVGTRLLSGGVHAIPIVLFIVAFGSWVALSALLLRAGALPSVGASFMVTVSTQSLAALAALLSGAERAPWLTVAAAVLCLLGLVLYLLVLLRFDFRQLLTGAGDHWVAGGALAISALASSQVGLAADRAGALHWLVVASHTASTIVWIAAIAWLPILLATEIIAPRLRYDVRRWATVFPVGMYAACSFEVGRIHHLHALRSVASVWTWVSLAVWLVVALGALARLQQTC